MIGWETPETCWAVNKRQDDKLENCCIWLVIYLNCTMMHGLTNPKINEEGDIKLKTLHTLDLLRGEQQRYTLLCLALLTRKWRVPDAVLESVVRAEGVRRPLPFSAAILAFYFGLYDISQFNSVRQAWNNVPPVLYNYLTFSRQSVVNNLSVQINQPTKCTNLSDLLLVV